MQKTVKRAVRTFLQAAVGYFVANIAMYAGASFEDVDVIKTALLGVGVSAIAAGLAAVMNLPKGGAQ